MLSAPRIVLLLYLCSWIDAFAPYDGYRRSFTRLHAAKGFGKKEEDLKPPNKLTNNSETTTTKPSPAQPKTSINLNSGQQALLEMRRQAAEAKDAELRLVRDIRSQDEQMKMTPAAIPEKVAMRMGKRMIPFVGLPLFGGMGTFVLFWYLATYQDLEFPPALVATSTFVLLAFGLVGITYSVLSASWDPEREGSILGREELQKNVQTIREGLSRSKENAIVRDKMARLSEEEIQSALKDLDRRETKKRTMTLEEKLNG